MGGSPGLPFFGGAGFLPLEGRLPFFGGAGFLPLEGRLPLFLGGGLGARSLGEGGFGCGFGGAGGGGGGLLFGGGGAEGGGGGLSATDIDFRRGPVPLKKSGGWLVGSCWVFEQRVGLDGGYRVSSVEAHELDEEQCPQHAGTGSLAQFRAGSGGSSSGEEIVD